MRSHPGRCVQALERIQEVLRAEFDDLEPPDCVFVLSQLLWCFHEATDRSLKGQKKSYDNGGAISMGPAPSVDPSNRATLSRNCPLAMIAEVGSLDDRNLELAHRAAQARWHARQ
jgi:hypothetical protein